MNIIRMPQIGVSNESAILSEWKVAPGSSVKKGEILFTAETDKATYDVEAEVGGVLLKIIFKEGDEIKIGEPIAYVGEAGEQIETGVGETAAGPDREEQKDAGNVPAAAPEKQEIPSPVMDVKQGRQNFRLPQGAPAGGKNGR